MSDKKAKAKALPKGWIDAGGNKATREAQSGEFAFQHEENAETWDELVEKCEVYDAQRAAKGLS